eukprot:TRINITY_DN117_c0_g1_i1.p1 TRINITY_DN117_c0_g1~~TRINITY_DN117_c0_g1_i1.p1  ORF type:complete len:498 (-),score=164.95 TRINITY_DN117_c0_g1_i1:83-1576(-)
MKRVLGIVVVSLLLVLVASVAPPTAVQVSVPTGASPATGFGLIKAIGATSLNTQGPADVNNPTASNVAGLASVQSFPAGVINVPGNAFQYGGVVVTDNSYQRAVFYRNPIQNSGDSGDIVFGRQNFQNAGNAVFSNTDNNFDVTRAGQNIIFADTARAYVYPMANYTDPTNYPPAAYFPSAVLGSCTNCSYQPYTTGAGIAADDTRIYYANTQCGRILVWNTTAVARSLNYAEPYYVLGKAGPGGCTEACNATNSYTCITPFRLSTDCYGGLWVFDGASQSIVHFPVNSQTADFAFVLSVPFRPSAISMGSGSRCSYMALSNSNPNPIHHILNVTYSGARPTAVTSQFTFGVGATGAGVGGNTNNIGLASGLSWDEANPDYLFVNDLTNNRIVYFTPFGQAAASPVTVPSQSTTPSLTNSRSVSPSRTTSITPSISLTPSSSVTPSTTPTSGLTTTASPSLTPAMSGNVPMNGTDTATPTQDPTTGGAASSLSSWLF